MATDDELDDARVLASLGRILSAGDPYTGLPLVDLETNLFPDAITAAVRATPLAAAAAAQAKADAAVPSTAKGQADGVAELDEDSLVPLDQVPVDAILADSRSIATFVRFLDETGAPLVGKLVTITVNSTTGEIDDITSEDI
jgi:hypothetical protein